MKLSDTRFVVTGAASGLGRAAALYLAREGGRVAAFDIDEEGLETLRREGGEAILPYVADVSNEDQVVAQVRRADAEIGGLNGLVNHAGIFRDGLLIRDGGVRMPLSQWRKVIDVDLTGMFLMVREAAGAMVESRQAEGVIVLLSSISRHGNVGQASYSAAKAGVAADTRVWARELAPHGIRVGALSPGLFETPILDAIEPDALEEYVNRIPLARLGRPEELCCGLRFIIECGYFTGECIEVNGGFLF